jgi:two-component system sensor kinase FixL
MMPGAGARNRSQCAEIKELAVATASHQVLPLCCSTFFRPEPAFAALKAWVMEELLRRALGERPVRVWIPGCGTGEQAYSIAMLLTEHFQSRGRQPNVRIFATDAQANSIKVARAGVYSESDLDGVSAPRLQQFFDCQGTKRYHVNAALRDCVMFARHDLDNDPPLSRLDFVSCPTAPARLAPESRTRLHAVLHFALNEGGYLLLGPDETLTPAADLFEPLDTAGYVYRRIGEARQSIPLGVLEDSVEAAHNAHESFSWSQGMSRSRSGSIPSEEEFHFTHEDLETSRETLASLNEELTAINSQLAAQVAELEGGRHNMVDLLCATNIAVLFLDAELRIERFTPLAATLLGVCERDLGRPWSDVARGFDEQLAVDAQLTLETRTPIEKNVRTHHHKCYLRRVQVFRSEGVRVGGVVVTFVDISRQIESDAQLRRFAAMLRDSADAIMVMDFGGRIVAWNRGAQRLYGYTQSEALKLNVRDLMTGDRLDSTLEVMRRVSRGEAMSAFDTQRRTRDGRVVDVSATVALLFDAAGNPESLAAAERDITARRRAEDETRMLNARLEQRVAERAAELQHSEGQIRAILDATADAVVTIDILGRIATFNRAAERIFGYAASEVIGENVTVLIPPEERVGRYGYKATATRSYASRLIGRSHEISGRRKDGSIFPIQLSVNSVEGRDLFVGVARDMTEHRALQKEIIDVAMLEQRRIGQELHDGTQQELTGLGLLAASLADSLSRNNAATAGQVAARVARGIELCNQRVRSLARGMVPVPVDREGLMTALAELARQTTEMHGIPCGFECPSPVEIDNDTEATHLYRIAQEAVSNATRHAKPSAIWIRLEQEDGRLILEVQDTGIGLQAAVNSGRGVGLRLMEHRCAMIGGNFAIDPRQEGGTCIVCSVLRPEEQLN